MGDATLKPSGGDDLVLSNDNGSAKIEVNEGGDVEITPSTSLKVTLGGDSGDDFAVDTDKLIVEGDTGQIGVGTSDPISPVHINVNATDSIPTNYLYGQADDNILVLRNKNTSANYSGIKLETRSSGASVWLIANEWQSQYLGDLVFRGRSDGTNSAERLRIDSDGDVTISTGNLVIGSAGSGIDFSNQTTATGGSPANQAELLDHFETGTFTPNIVNFDGSQFADFSTNSKGVYTRVGDLICVSIYLEQSSYTAQRVAADAFLTNLPFTPYNSTGSSGQVATGVIQNTRSSINGGSADDDSITLNHSTHLSGSYIIYYKNGQVVEERNFQDGSNNSKSVYLRANFSYRSQ